MEQAADWANKDFNDLDHTQVSPDAIAMLGNPLLPDRLCQVWTWVNQIENEVLRAKIAWIITALISAVNWLTARLQSHLSDEAQNEEIHSLREQLEGATKDNDSLRKNNTTLQGEVSSLQEKVQFLQAKGEALTESFWHLEEIARANAAARFCADRERTSRIEDEALLDENGDPCDMGDFLEEILEGIHNEGIYFFPEDASESPSSQKSEPHTETESVGDTGSSEESANGKDGKKKSEKTKRAKKRAPSKKKATQDSDETGKETADQDSDPSQKSKKSSRTWTTRRKGDQAEAIKHIAHHEYKLTLKRPDGTDVDYVQDKPFTEEDVARLLEELYPGSKLKKAVIRDGQYVVRYVEYAVATHQCTVKYTLLVPVEDTDSDQPDTGDEATEPELADEAQPETNEASAESPKCKDKPTKKCCGKKGRKAKKAQWRRRKDKRKPRTKYKTVRGKITGGQPYRQNSHVSPSLLAKVLATHFALMVPIFRIVRMLWLKGLGVSQAAVYNWINMCAADLIPLADFLLEDMKTYGYLHADESPGHVLREPGRKNETTSYFWFYATAVGAPHPACVIRYHPGRKGEFPEEDLKGWVGKLITDAFQGYNGLKGVIRCLCMCHARRYFFIAAQFGFTRFSKVKARQIVALFNQLFAYERAYKAEGLTPEQILERRKAESKKVFEKIASLSQEIVANSKYKSGSLFRAASYFCNNKEGLSRFLEDGRVPLSNNRAERMVKPYSILRSNCLFSGSPQGAINTAACLSIARTAELNELDVQKYFEYILTRIAETPVERRRDKEFLTSLAPWSEGPMTHCEKISRGDTEKPVTFRKTA